MRERLVLTANSRLISVPAVTNAGHAAYRSIYATDFDHRLPNDIEAILAIDTDPSTIRRRDRRSRANLVLQSVPNVA